MDYQKQINFECKECGKCCKHPPRMNFYEMLENGKNFIFQAVHNVRISSIKNVMEKNKIEHLQKFSHTIALPELDLSFYYFIDFMPIILQTYKNCPKLENNLCSIYGSRPNRCRISPILFDSPEEEQWKNIQWFEEKSKKEDWKCIINNERKNVIFDNYQLSTRLFQIYENELLSIRDITDKYIHYLSIKSEEEKNQHLKNIFTMSQKNGLIVSDTIQFLQMANYYNIIDEKFGYLWISEQSELIEKELNFAIKLKNKENLQITRFYKKILNHYQKIMKEKNIFQIYSHLDFEIYGA